MNKTPESNLHLLYLYADELHFTAMVHRFLKHAISVQSQVRYNLPEPLSSILTREGEAVGLLPDQLKPIQYFADNVNDVRLQLLQALQESKASQFQTLWVLHNLSDTIHHPILLRETERTLSEVCKKHDMAVFCICGPLDELSESQIVSLLHDHAYYYENGEFKKL